MTDYPNRSLDEALGHANQEIGRLRTQLKFLRQRCERLIASARRHDALTVVVDGFDVDMLKGELAALERDGAKVADRTDEWKPVADPWTVEQEAEWKEEVAHAAWVDAETDKFNENAA